MQLVESGCTHVFLADGPDRPDIIALHPEIGLIATDFANAGEEIGHRRKLLNQKIKSLRSDIPEVEEVSLVRAVVGHSELDEPELIGKSSVIFGSNAMNSGSWIDEFPRGTADADALESIALLFNPARFFTSVGRRGAFDGDKEDRHATRIQLDRAQADLATSNVEDILLITGPPGCGKTLVLAGRARWLADEHPDWTIQIVCYNAGLVSYINTLVGRRNNINVSTFHRFATSNGHRFSGSDERDARRDFLIAQRRGIETVCDVLLVDEWQDFSPSWITYCLEMVRPGHGGVLLTGDSKQAIYQEHAPLSALADRNVKLMELNRPYRSTRQILEFVAAMDPAFTTEGTPAAPEGEPVDVIHAKDWDSQAEAAVWEVLRLIESGERIPKEIAILVTRKSLMGRVSAALSNEEIPFTLSLAEPTKNSDPGVVTVATIHSAKGREFDFVILLGIDALKPLAKEELPQKSRVGYVGPTRARDQLIVTYTKSTPLIAGLSKTSDGTYRHWEFPQDFVGAEET